MDSRRKRQPRGATHELVIPRDPERTTQRSPSSSAGQYAHLQPIRDGKNRYDTISLTRQQPHKDTTSFGSQPLPDSEKGAANSHWRAEKVTEKEEEKYEEVHIEVPNRETGIGKQILKCCTHMCATISPPTQSYLCCHYSYCCLTYSAHPCADCGSCGLCPYRGQR